MTTALEIGLMHYRINSLTPKTGYLRGIGFSLVGLLSLAQASHAATNLAWDPSSSAGVAGYRLYYGSASGQYAQSLDVGNTTSTAVTNLVNGSTYYFAVTSYTTSGQESVKSNQVAYTVPANVAPTVSLTAPTTGATYTAPASIPLTVAASDSDGSIKSVEFYNGTTRFATLTSSPYTFNWTGVAAGTYTVTARVYDNQGVSTTSAASTVKVAAATTTANKPPVVSLLAPLNATNYKAPGNITLTASASDSDGTITKVAFYNGTTFLGQSTVSPYKLAVSGVPVGTYTVTARAYDNKGASTTSAAAIVKVSTQATKNVALAWDASAGTNVANYAVHYGTTSGKYTQTVPAGNVTNTTLANLMIGTKYYVSVTAVNTATCESIPSNEVSFTAAAN